MIALSEPDRARLITMLEITRTSNFPGERNAAISAANRLLRQHSLTWRDVLLRNFPPAGSSEPSWREDIAHCIRKLHELTEWEQNFIVSLRGFRRPSAKQQTVLRQIAEKVRAEARAA
jgi:hypothetical protein